MYEGSITQPCRAAKSSAAPFYPVMCNLAAHRGIPHNGYMNDDQTPPKKPDIRPANANEGPQVRSVKKPAARKPVSAESRFVGYLVLGFGVLAVLAVVLLAMSARKPQSNATDTQPTASAEVLLKQKIRDKGDPVPPPAPTALTQKAAQGLFEDMGKPGDLKPKLEKTPSLFFKRQPGLEASSVEGSWEGVIGHFAAALLMKGGTYQLIMANPDQYGFRNYSIGTYAMTEDLIVMQPRMDWPPPAAPRGVDITYKNITVSSFPVLVGIIDGKMYWQAPPPEERRVRDIGKLPIMLSEDQDFIVWRKTKN